MSNPFSPEQIVSMRDNVRRQVAQASDHENQLQALLLAADETVHQAETVLSEARTSGAAAAANWQQVCAAQLSRSVAHAEAARRACEVAREQHVSARRLLAHLYGEDAGASAVAREWAPGVLVVDDAADVREIVAGVLRDAGFIVRTAVNGLDALIAAYEMQPAVIVMDVTMPVLDGIEATRLIKSTEGIRHAKVIAHTGNPSLPDLLVQQFFTAVVPKPSPPAVVLAAVQNAAAA